MPHGDPYALIRIRELEAVNAQIDRDRTRLIAENEGLTAEVERLADRSVCSACGSDVPESGVCPYGGCIGGDLIPASDLAWALRTLHDNFKEDREHWLAEDREWEKAWKLVKGTQRGDRVRLIIALSRIIEIGQDFLKSEYPNGTLHPADAEAARLEHAIIEATDILGCVSPAEGTPQVGTEEGRG